MDEHYEDEPIEGYCVRCRETVEIENPAAVWTRKGMPATRGECPLCGGTVFRMGITHLHDPEERPSAVEVGDSQKRKHPKLERDTVYVMHTTGDEAIARQIADDLEKVGIAAWIHQEDDDVNWAGGVHPALKECRQMVYVLSDQALHDERLTEGIRFFRENRKPIVIAQVSPEANPPDTIRRSPRFNFTSEYKRAFREMVQALAV